MNFIDIESLSNLFDELARYYSNQLKRSITRREIFNALFLILGDNKNLEWAGDLWDINLTEKQIKQLLDDFDFDILDRIIETEDNIISINNLMQRRILIRNNGLIWIIHKNDKDPFPSNPHAHCLDQNIKLDLSNGNCYRNKKFLEKINKKDLELIRDKANKIFNGKLPRKLID